MFAKTVLILITSVLLAGPKDDKEKKDAKDQDAVQGAWKVTSVEQAGQKSDLEMVITIKGENYTVKMNGQEIEEGMVKFNPDKKPKTIDFKITKGNDKGKNQMGIYTLEGDMLRICVTQPDKDDRPKEMAAKEGTEHILFALKREKK